MTIVPIFVSVILSVAAAQPRKTTPTVTGNPYSADQVQEYTRTLENGESTTSTNVIGHFFRDSQGRTRTESALKSSPTWRIEILDPVAGVDYVLDDKNKVAHRTRPQAAAPGQNAPPQMTIESLGTQMIEGVLVEGTRMSRALPPRDGIPSRFTIETWDSVELKVTMLTKSSNGYTSKLVNLRRAEPNPALFRPPPITRLSINSLLRPGEVSRLNQSRPPARQPLVNRWNSAENLGTTLGGYAVGGVLLVAGAGGPAPYPAGSSGFRRAKSGSETTRCSPSRRTAMSSGC